MNLVPGDSYFFRVPPRPWQFKASRQSACSRPPQFYGLERVAATPLARLLWGIT